MEFEKPKLKIGEEYHVNSYPNEGITYGTTYMGEKKGVHYFDRLRTFCMLVHDNLMIDKEGVITHKEGSSISIPSIKRSEINLEKSLEEVN